MESGDEMSAKGHGCHGLCDLSGKSGGLREAARGSGLAAAGKSVEAALPPAPPGNNYPADTEN